MGVRLRIKWLWVRIPLHSVIVNQDLKSSKVAEYKKNCLKSSKTEAVLFKLSRKLTYVPIKLKLNGKRLYPTKSVKYFGIKVDENLNWKHEISDVAIKLNRANSILSNLRHFIYRKTLKPIYHVIFEPHLCYSSLVWAQNLSSVIRLSILQKKSLWIIYLRSRSAHTSPLFRETNILIKMLYCLFIKKYFNNFLPTTFKNSFTFSSDMHGYRTCWCNVVPPRNTTLYGRNSFNISAAYTWNHLQKLNENNLFYQLPPSKFKIIIKKLFLNNYN